VTPQRWTSERLARKIAKDNGMTVEEAKQLLHASRFMSGDSDYMTDKSILPKSLGRRLSSAAKAVTPQRLTSQRLAREIAKDTDMTVKEAKQFLHTNKMMSAMHKSDLLSRARQVQDQIESDRAFAASLSEDYRLLKAENARDIMQQQRVYAEFQPAEAVSAESDRLQAEADRLQAAADRLQAAAQVSTSWWRRFLPF